MASQQFDPNTRLDEFQKLVMRNDRQLKVYALSLVPNWADADDILQDTKIELWKRFNEYDRAGNFCAWARKILYYRVLTFRNNARRERAYFSQAAFDLVAEEASSVAEEANARMAALVVCLKKLSRAARHLLWRCTIVDSTAKEAAVALGRSVRGTQRAVAKIRSDLQQCIEREMRKEERS